MALFWPVLAESLLTTLVSFVSAAMGKGISVHTMPAVGLVISINMVLFGLFMAFSSGITVVVAQAYGRGDTGQAAHAAAQAVVAVAMAAACIGLVLGVLRQPMISLLFGSSHPATQSQASNYLLYSLATLPLWAIYSALSGIMRARGNNVSPMIASILANVALVIVTFFCMNVLDMGIDALGCGLVASRVACAGYLMFVQWRGDGTMPLGKLSLKLDMAVLRPVLRIAVPAGMDSLFFNGTKLVVMVFMSGMGEAVLNANVACNNITSLLLLPGGAVQVIVVTMVGQAYGAGRFDEAKRYMIKMTGLACLLQAAISLLSWPFLRVLIAMNVDTTSAIGAEAAKLAFPVLVLYSIVSIVFWAPSFVTPNALRGAGDAVYTMKSSLGSLFVLRLLGSWLLGTVLGMGLLGIWLAMMADWVGRACFFVPRVLSGKWHKPADVDAEPKAV